MGMKLSSRSLQKDPRRSLENLLSSEMKGIRKGVEVGFGGGFFFLQTISKRC